MCYNTMKTFDLQNSNLIKLKVSPLTCDEASRELCNMEKKSTYYGQQRSKSLGINETNSLRSVLRDIASESSPTTKKAVHFADHNGLALVNVRKFMPSSDDLDALDNAAKKRNLFLRSNSTGTDTRSRPNCFSGLPDVYGLVLGFSQPILDPCFPQRLDSLKVSLENASLHGRTINGSVKVCNISYEKIVAIRYTNDSWLSYSEMPCNYIPDSSNGETDKFSFSLDLTTKQKTLQFAVRFEVNGQEFWDNNHGKNYIVFSTG